MALLAKLFRLRLSRLLPLLLVSSSLFVCAVAAQDVAKLPFLAEHYDVAATLDPSNQTLSAVAKVQGAGGQWVGVTFRGS